MKTNNTLFLRRRSKIPLPPTDGPDRLPRNFLASMLKNLESLGFTFSEPLIEACQALSLEQLTMLYQELIVALKAAKVQPVLLPGSVYALGSNQYPAAREMIDAGLAVVLATDFNPGSSPTPSMPMILSLACTQMKMTPAEAITAATINAAYSLGRGDEIGSLERGKRADFVIHDCEDYRELAYFFGVEHAGQVYCGGRLAFSRSA